MYNYEMQGWLHVFFGFFCFFFFALLNTFAYNVDCFVLTNSTMLEAVGSTLRLNMLCA